MASRAPYRRTTGPDGERQRGLWGNPRESRFPTAKDVFQVQFGQEIIDAASRGEMYLSASALYGILVDLAARVDRTLNGDLLERSNKQGTIHTIFLQQAEEGQATIIDGESYLSLPNFKAWIIGSLKLMGREARSGITLTQLFPAKEDGHSGWINDADLAKALIANVDYLFGDLRQAAAAAKIAPLR